MKFMWYQLLLAAVLCLAYAEQQCCVQKVWRKLNGALPVCFKAEENGHAEFIAGFGINLCKLKYVRRDGFHECQYGHGGYFGCEAYTSHDGHNSHHAYVGHSYGGSYGSYQQYDEPQQDEPQQDQQQQQQYDEPQQDEPQQDQQQQQQQHQQHQQNKQKDPPQHVGPMNDFNQSPGQLFLQQISVFLTDEQDNVLFPQEPYEKPYFIEPSVNRPAWKSSLTLTIHDGPIGIVDQQKLRLYHGEDLFDMGTDDNSGTLCVDVYGYGDLVFPVSTGSP